MIILRFLTTEYKIYCAHLALCSMALIKFFQCLLLTPVFLLDISLATGIWIVCSAIFGNGRIARSRQQQPPPASEIPGFAGVCVETSFSNTRYVQSVRVLLTKKINLEITEEINKQLCRLTLMLTFELKFSNKRYINEFIYHIINMDG